MHTITAPDGYDYRKNPRMLTIRPLTLDEAKALRYGEHRLFIALDGTARTVKINGRPKTWKTRPGDVDIPVKYGMYEHATFSMRRGSWYPLDQALGVEVENA